MEWISEYCTQLLFSVCGYDSQARQKREDAKDESDPAKSTPWRRKVPYPHTGCLGHVEITERIEDGGIIRVAGLWDHNEGCKKAALERFPAIPLHEHVYQVALEQLASGASLTAVQERNQQMYDARLYHGMKEWDPKTANIRYIILPSDNVTLYRKMNRQTLNVDTTTLPEYNVHNWLDPQSKEYNTTIAEAVFHYHARANMNERFKICISTKEMDEAANKYAHHSQLILDGTFGICSSRLLLFIAMAVDEDRKGVPIAFFLFSAPTGNRATQAGYNTEILRELLDHWKSHLVRKYGTFNPYTCITDTDTKERGALLQVWNKITLLICRFHLRQCWTNHRKKVLTGSQGDYWKNHVREHLQSIEVLLIATVEHSAAINHLSQSRVYLAGLGVNPEAKSALKGGLSHLDYLDKHWMSVPMWQSWSEWGRVAASVLLNVTVEDVIPTTNHLESFNAILKRKYIRSWLHSGHRLRFDVLIMLLITRILPDIFKRRSSRKNHRLWVIQRFKDAAGGIDLQELQEKLQAHKLELEAQACRVCWWADDEKRRTLGEGLILTISKHVCQSGEGDRRFYTAICPSSQDPTRNYTVTLHRSGQGSCSCPDFEKRGGACKHLWALRRCIQVYVLILHVETPFNYPTTLQAAQQLISLPVDVEAVLDIPSNQAAPSVDWNAIQAFGQDDVCFGGDLDEGDLEDGGDEEFGGSTTEERAVLYSSNSAEAAINTQRQHRLEHDVSKILPRLHGIDNLLSDKPPLPESTLLDEFEQVLHDVLSKLATLRVQSNLSTSHTTDTQDNAVYSQKPVSARKRKDLKAPSPERGQKRKTSHGTM
ncbi:hypothetical protein HHX47_DHR9000388 [Lentinula edodes]|nr:hypothetical protein HHX47_DHR9000388 [Lentinula edodes]